MEIIFELSKEYKNLAIDEIIACLKSEKIKYHIIEFNNDLLIVSADINNQILNQISNRLSLTYNVGELLFTSSHSIQRLESNALKTKIDLEGSIAVSYRNRAIDINSQIIVKSLAKIFTKKRKVKLYNPDIEIRCLITNNKNYVSKNIIKIDRTQFEKRKAQYRPFFSPISLHPKLSRVIINISEVKKNEILFDPFCGTGGILIEAGILGINIIGNDIDKKLIDGCKKNLNYYNISNFKLYNLDIGKICEKVKKVDVVVTDFPYGKSTTTKGEKLQNLYQRAFININTVLKNDGKAVIGFANKDMISLSRNYLSIEKIYEIKVHNSLTRYFIVYRKKNAIF